jgi:hypothetical protein
VAPHDQILRVLDDYFGGIYAGDIERNEPAARVRDR